MSESVDDAVTADDPSEPSEQDEKDSSLRRIFSMLAHFGRRHRGAFVKGCVGAVLMVATRIALPWPAHALMHHWKHVNALGEAAAVPGPLGIDHSVVLGLAFLGLLAALGSSDALVRIQFARFSIGTLRDVRAAAIQAALRATGRLPAGDGEPQPVASDGEEDPAAVPPARKVKSGDLVARLVGDTARVKAGVKGGLVHVVPSSLLYIGVTVVLYWLNFNLGLVFSAAGVAMTIVTFLGARAMYRKTKKYRKKEGKLAEHINRALEGGTLHETFTATNMSSGRHEAKLATIQSLTTWGTYVIYGIAVLATVVIGTHEIAKGTLESRDMVIFLMYVLILRGPTIRLARQGSRLGKTLGSAKRVLQVLEREPAPAPASTSALADPTVPGCPAS